MNLLLLIAQTSLLLSGSQAAKLTRLAETTNNIQNEFQSKQQSDPRDNQDSLEMQDEEEGLNQTVSAGQGNSVPISQSNLGSLGGLRSELSINPRGTQGFLNQDNTKQDNQNFSSIKSTQFHTQGLQTSVASGAAGVSQDATSNGIAGQSSTFFRNKNNVPQNFGTSVSNMVFGHANSSPREVHSISQSGIRHETKLGFGSSQGTFHDDEEYNQSSIVTGPNQGTSGGIGFQQKTPGTNAESNQDDGSLQFDHEISNNGLSPGFEHNQGTSNIGFGVRHSDNSALISAQSSHVTGSSHEASNTFVHGVSGLDTGLSHRFEHNQGPLNAAFEFRQSDNSASSGYSQVTDSALRTDQSSHATSSSHGTSNTFVHGVSESDTRLSPGFEHNQGPSNVGFGDSQSDNSDNFGYSQVTDSAFRNSQSSHATGSSHGNSNTFVHGESGSSFHQNTAVLNNAAIGTRFDQSSAIPGAQFGQKTSGSAVRFDKENEMRHEQQNIRANTGFRQVNIGASNAFSQTISSPHSHSNIRNGFGQSVSSTGLTGVRHSSSNQQDKSKAEIYRFNLVHESSGLVDNFHPLGRSTSAQPNIVNPNNIGSLSTNRGSRAESGFGELRQTNLIQQTARGVQPTQIQFRQNQVSSTNPTFFGNRNPTSHVTQQPFPITSANQERAYNTASQRNINSIGSQREVNSLGVQTQQKVFNAVRQQALTSSQINRTPELLQRNQILQESAPSGGVFNNLQNTLGRPVIHDSQRQRLFSRGPSSTSNTGNKGFKGATNSQITRPQTHLNTPNQSNSIHQESERNNENELKHIVHNSNSNPQRSSQLISTSADSLGVSQNTNLNTGLNTQFSRNPGRIYSINRTDNTSKK